MEINDTMPSSPAATAPNDEAAMTNAPAKPPAAGELRRLLKQHFGYDEFRPRQEEIIANALAGRHGLVIIPTGGGKSLCYQLPAMAMEGLTLVVSPLIALMKDQVDALRANGVPAAFINSTLDFNEIGRVQQAALDGRIRVLYAAPERVTTPGFLRFLESLRVGLIAIDEAHCISEWGHDFRPDYRNLAELRARFPNTPVMALTATATERVRDDIAAQLRLGGSPRFISSFDRANLTYSVRPKERKDRDFDALLRLLNERRGESAIIYCFSRKETEELADRLSDNGHRAVAYHAGLDPETRRRAQERFIEGDVPIVAATIAFGMGIDKPDIRLVVHYSLPKSIEGYYQETGRAGRDGEPSDCVLFFSQGDRGKQEYFIRQMEDGPAREMAERQLEQVVEYGRLRRCRRKYLLAYFGETMEGESRGRCDSCLATYRSVDVTEPTKKILSAVIRTGERFGIAYVNRVLLGSGDKRIGKFGHDRLSVYGIVDDYDRNGLRGIAEMLIERGSAGQGGRLTRRHQGDAGGAGVAAQWGEPCDGRARGRLPYPDGAAERAALGHGALRRGPDSLRGPAGAAPPARRGTRVAGVCRVQRRGTARPGDRQAHHARSDAAGLRGRPGQAGTVRRGVPRGDTGVRRGGALSRPGEKSRR